jgi:hypothetical protein
MLPVPTPGSPVSRHISSIVCAVVVKNRGGQDAMMGGGKGPRSFLPKLCEQDVLFERLERKMK